MGDRYWNFVSRASDLFPSQSVTGMSRFLAGLFSSLHSIPTVPTISGTIRHGRRGRASAAERSGIVSHRRERLDNWFVFYAYYVRRSHARGNIPSLEQYHHHVHMRLYEQEEEAERRIYERYYMRDTMSPGPIDPERELYLMDVGAYHRVRRFFGSIKGFHTVRI